MKYRILFIHDVHTFSGGSETHWFSILKGLDKDQFSVVAVVPSKGNVSERVRELGIRVEFLTFPSWRKLNAVPYWIPAIYRLTKLIKRERIDLVHSYSFWKTPFVYLASKLAGVPCVVHVLDETEKWKISRYWLKKVDKLIFISYSAQRYYVAADVPEDKTAMIHVGIDLDNVPCNVDGSSVRSQFGIGPEDPVIGCVARLAPAKGFEYLFQALTLIKPKLPNIKCFIIGTHTDENVQMWMRLVEKLCLTENVIFTGFVKDIHPFLAVMDVFVLATLYEGFGIAFAEAMAMSKPVVGTYVGGVPEVVEDGLTGFLVPPRDSQKLADRVLELLSDKALREKMGNAGYKRVSEHFNIYSIGKRLGEHYLSILSNKPSKEKSLVS
jgi:glycosyltransferase involved in cell wall biosynthesis